MNFIKKLAMACLGATAIALAVGKPGNASVFFNSDTGHFYEYVSGEYSWSEAKASAEARYHNGLQGYLATITSEAEQNFIISNIGIPKEPSLPLYGGWLGASDAATEGIWQWVTGPEAGTVFWENGTPIGYNNFDPVQPDNSRNKEDYAHIFGVRGDTWNDLRESGPLGYYVEYGGLEPEPSAEPVPEPSSIFGLLTFAALGATSRLRNYKSR